MTTPVNVDSCLRKLRTSIAGCSPHGVARPMWATEVRDIIDLIEQQQAELRMHRQAQEALNEAFAEVSE